MMIMMMMMKISSIVWNRDKKFKIQYNIVKLGNFHLWTKCVNCDAVLGFWGF